MFIDAFPTIEPNIPEVYLSWNFLNTVDCVIFKWYIRFYLLLSLESYIKIKGQMHEIHARG